MNREKFEEQVRKILSKQPPELVEGFINQLNYPLMQAHWEAFGELNYRSIRDDSLISEMENAVSVLEKLNQLSIFNNFKNIHLYLGDGKLSKESTNTFKQSIEAIKAVLDLNKSQNTSGRPLSLNQAEKMILNTLRGAFISVFPDKAATFNRNTQLWKIGTVLLERELPNNTLKIIS